MLEKLGITSLNDMQREAGDAILRGKQDVVVLSPTGTGKTLAYLLPLVELVDAQQDVPQALVIVPGRELAMQSDRVLKDLGSGLRSAACYGGRTAMEEHRRLKEVKPQIIFGTPGRLNDHLDKGNISPYAVRYLVIDEFDKCLEMGFHDEMARLLKKLPGVRRHILLSATDADAIPDFVSMGRTQRIDYLSDEEQVNDRVTAYVVKSPVKDKLATLRQLLCSFGDQQTVVFLGFRDAVERVGDYLRREGFAASVFHGGMEQKQREDALYKFSNGSANVFVSTDLGSRGLDIPDIQNIVHYHLPLHEQELVHRVGRTARWDKQGRTFFIVGPEEQLPEFVDCDNEEYSLPSLPREGLGVSLPKMATIYIGKGKKDKISKGDIVGFLCKKGGLQPSEIGRIDVMDRYAYVAVSRPRFEQVLRLTKGEKIKGIKTVIEPVK
jgi:superfamily II DNA/RNA helicase